MSNTYSTNSQRITQIEDRRRRAVDFFCGLEWQISDDAGSPFYDVDAGHFTVADTLDSEVADLLVNAPDDLRFLLDEVKRLQTVVNTFMDASRLVVTNNVLFERDGDLSPVYTLNMTDDPIAGTPCIRAGWLRQLEQARLLALAPDAGESEAR